jgi:hypothetical protein
MVERIEMIVRFDSHNPTQRATQLTAGRFQSKDLMLAQRPLSGQCEGNRNVRRPLSGMWCWLVGIEMAGHPFLCGTEQSIEI